MAKLPNPNELQTAMPRFAGVDQYKVSTAPEEAKMRLAQSVEGFGEAMQKVMDQQDEYAAERANTEMQNRALDLTKGNDKTGVSGFTQIKGQNVTDDDTFYETQVQLFDNAADDISNNLKNDKQREMFNRRKDIIKLTYRNQLTDHITSQRDAVDANTYTNGIGTSLNVVMQNYDQPGARDPEMLHIENLTKSEADRIGGDYQSMLRENKTKYHGSVIDAAIANEDYGYAQDYFDNVVTKEAKNLDEKGVERMQENVRKAGIRKISQDKVNEYHGMNLTREQAKQLARNDKMLDKNREALDATLTRIDRRWDEDKASIQAAERQNGDDAWHILANTKSMDAIPEKILEGMDGKERLALEDAANTIAKGRKVQTDWNTYYYLKSKVGRPPIKGEIPFEEENLMRYANRLNDTELKELINLQTDRPKNDLVRSKMSILKQGADEAGISAAQIKKGYGDELTEYYKAIDDDLAMKGIKEPALSDIEDSVLSLNLRIKKDPTAWFFKGERPAYSAEIEGVPSNMIPFIARSLVGVVNPVTGKQVEISDENIKAVYERNKYRYKK